MLVLEPMLSANQIAAHLSVHPATIRAWYAKKMMPQPDIRKHRLVRWKAETLADFLKDPIGWQEKNPPAENNADEQA